MEIVFHFDEVAKERGCSRKDDLLKHKNRIEHAFTGIKLARAIGDRPYIS